MEAVTDRDLTKGVPAAELREGVMIAGRIREDQILLVRDGGEVLAVGAMCTHYGGPLAEGTVMKGTIRCPWHHACFELKTGAVLRSPALAPLPRWRVEQRGDRFFVSEPIGPVPHSPSGGPESIVIIGMGAPPV